MSLWAHGALSGCLVREQLSRDFTIVLSTAHTCASVCAGVMPWGRRAGHVPSWPGQGRLGILAGALWRDPPRRGSTHSAVSGGPVQCE